MRRFMTKGHTHYTHTHIDVWMAHLHLFDNESKTAPPSWGIALFMCGILVHKCGYLRFAEEPGLVASNAVRCCLRVVPDLQVDRWFMAL